MTDNKYHLNNWRKVNKILQRITNSSRNVNNQEKDNKLQVIRMVEIQFLTKTYLGEGFNKSVHKMDLHHDTKITSDKQIKCYKKEALH